MRSPDTIQKPEGDDAAPKHGAIGHLSADDELQQAVCGALIEDARLDSSGIGVRVSNDNTVILAGTVKTRDAWLRAFELARKQPGVSSVQADELHVAGE